MNVSPEALAAILLTTTGAVLSLAFRFIPKLKAWYDTQEDKGPIMFAAVFVTTLAYYGLSCTPLAAELNISVSCTSDSIGVITKALAFIVLGNQGTYLYFTKKQTEPDYDFGNGE